MHKQGIADASEIPISGTPDLARFSLVDGLSIRAQPPANLFQNPHGLFRNRAVTPGTYIQQIISTIAGARDQDANDGPRRLPLVIRTVISPALIQRHATFPRRSISRCGNPLFRSREVSR